MPLQTEGFAEQIVPLAEQTPSHAASNNNGVSRRRPRFCPRWVERGRGRRLAGFEAHTSPSYSTPPRLGARLGRRRSSTPITNQHNAQQRPMTGCIVIAAAAASGSCPCSFRGPLARPIRELHWHCSLSESSAPFAPEADERQIAALLPLGRATWFVLDGDA